MSKLSRPIHKVVQRHSRSRQRRAKVLRKVAKLHDFLYFGSIHREDDIEPIHGFTASVTHVDQHFSVGQLDDYAVRIVDRFDTHNINVAGPRTQMWTIVEISLLSRNVPHIFLIPTGESAKEYQRVFRSHYQLQPLNATLLRQHSPEVHGRFQILAPTSRMLDVEGLLTTSLVMGIASRFWPHGIEIKGDKLYLYLTDHRLSETMVSSVIASGLWLAQSIDDSLDN